jgi:hypothetical protein
LLGRVVSALVSGRTAAGATVAVAARRAGETPGILGKPVGTGTFGDGGLTCVSLGSDGPLGGVLPGPPSVATRPTEMTTSATAPTASPTRFRRDAAGGVRAWLGPGDAEVVCGATCLAVPSRGGVQLARDEGRLVERTDADDVRPRMGRRRRLACGTRVCGRTHARGQVQRVSDPTKCIAHGTRGLRTSRSVLLEQLCDDGP